jgi:hypothetical protein
VKIPANRSWFKKHKFDIVNRVLMALSRTVCATTRSMRGLKSHIPFVDLFSARKFSSNIMQSDNIDSALFPRVVVSGIQSTRPIRKTPIHLLVGDSSQPGLHGSCGVKAVAGRKIHLGEVVFQECGEIIKSATMHSIQISETAHVNTRGEGRFMGHSFNPNLKVRIDELSSHPIDMIALREIDEGEALTFNYCSTEVSAPFRALLLRLGRSMRRHNST